MTKTKTFFFDKDKLLFPEPAISDALNTFKTRKKVSYFFVS